MKNYCPASHDHCKLHWLHQMSKWWIEKYCCTIDGEEMCNLLVTLESKEKKIPPKENNIRKNSWTGWLVKMPKTPPVGSWLQLTAAWKQSTLLPTKQSSKHYLPGKNRKNHKSLQSCKKKHCSNGSGGQDIGITVNKLVAGIDILL